MSQIMTQATSALWKPGNKSNNLEFLVGSNWKRLEKEQPTVYKQIRQEEGFTCQDHEYEYKVGKSQYGLWLSRRKMGMEGLQNIEQGNDKPPARPTMRDINANVADTTLILAISQITEKMGEIVEGLKLVALSNLAQSEEERETCRAMLMK